MKWGESSKPECFPEVVYAREIVDIAYHEGFLNWYSYQRALEKLTANKNGSWMFVQKSKKDD